MSELWISNVAVMSERGHRRLGGASTATKTWMKGVMLFCAAVAGCDRATPAGTAPSASAAPSAPSAATPASAMTRAQAEEQARALLGRWLAAQNERSFQAYRDLYALDFAGVRRTPSGEEKRLALDEWATDRKRLFDHPQKVAADEIKVAPWHDGAMRAGEVELTFVQRWMSPNAADHGPKEMRLRLGADGQLRIIREAMLSSTKGWRAEDAAEVDGTSLKSPVTVSAVWRNTVRGPGGTSALTLVAKDAAGMTKEWSVPNSECSGDTPDPAQRFVKKHEGGTILEGAHACGPEYNDVFRVVADAAGVVVKDRTMINLHEENAVAKDTGWVDLLRVNLAKGVEVRGK